MIVGGAVGISGQILIFVNQLSKHSSISASLKKMKMFLYMQALLVLAWQLFK
jgi:hypothetical protein